MKVVELKGKYGIEIHANKRDVITKVVITGVERDLIAQVKKSLDVLNVISGADYYPDIEKILPEVEKTLIEKYGKFEGGSLAEIIFADFLDVVTGKDFIVYRPTCTVRCAVDVIPFKK